MKKPTIKLAEGEHIVTAWAENGYKGIRLICYIVRGPDGKMCERALQPEEQSDEMRLIHPFCITAHNELMGWTNAIVKQAKP